MIDGYNTKLVPDEKIKGLYTIAVFNEEGKEKDLTEIIEGAIDNLLNKPQIKNTSS